MKDDCLRDNSQSTANATSCWVDVTWRFDSKERKKSWSPDIFRLASKVDDQGYSLHFPSRCGAFYVYDHALFNCLQILGHCASNPTHQEIQGQLKETTRNTRSILILAVIIHHLIVGDDSVGGYLRIRFLRLRKRS